MSLCRLVVANYSTKSTSWDHDGTPCKICGHEFEAYLSTTYTCLSLLFLSLPQTENLLFSGFERPLFSLVLSPYLSVRLLCRFQKPHPWISTPNWYFFFVKIFQSFFILFVWWETLWLNTGNVLSRLFSTPSYWSRTNKRVKI